MNNFRISKNNKLLLNAKELRKNLTPQEKRLWYGFLRPYKIKVYKQRIIGDFIADFYCHKARLVIELDGSHHFKHNTIVYDCERTKLLNHYGIAVIRFTNSQVDDEFELVCSRIDKEIKSRLSSDFSTPKASPIVGGGTPEA